MNNNYKEYSEIAELLKVIAHPVRLCIINGLINKGKCNVGYMQNCLDLPQSTISTHLSKLRAYGIIEGERNGLEISYRVKDERVIKIVNDLITNK
ncbi:MAG: metalloregulator ArsR/SmtB family transcription factor [Bacillota bacterium]|nr:metalloregulator ArsR/SmtB family transcription factor [Bacillota bacterium]